MQSSCSVNGALLVVSVATSPNERDRRRLGVTSSDGLYRVSENTFTGHVERKPCGYIERSDKGTGRYLVQLKEAALFIIIADLLDNSLSVECSETL